MVHFAPSGGYRRPHKSDPLRSDGAQVTYRGRPNMLWTILVILAIVALAIWILARVRGRRV